MPTILREAFPSLAVLAVILGCSDAEKTTPTNLGRITAEKTTSPQQTQFDQSDSTPLIQTPVDKIPAWVGESEGEPFNVKEYLESRSAPPDNAAPLYEAAFAVLREDLDDIGVKDFEEQIRKLVDFNKLAPPVIPVKEVEKTFRLIERAMEEIDVAQSKSHCVFLTDLSADALMPHAQTATTVSRCLPLQLLYARIKGDFELAHRSLHRSLRLSRDLRPRGHFACQLVSMAIDSRSFSAIERLILSDPGMTSDQCDQLLDLLVEHQRSGLDHFQELVRMDYIFARSSIQDLQTGRLTLGEIFNYLSGAETDKPVAIGPIPMNYSAEISACNRLYALALIVAKQPVASADEFAEFNREIATLRNRWDDFITKVNRTEPLQRPRLRPEMPAMQSSTWTAGVIPGRDAALRTTANLAGLQMLIALRRYYIANQRLPTNLDEASAESILKTVPMDPYSGKPLKFATVAGKPTIYSVGKDFTDNGGESDWNAGTQPGDFLFILPSQSTLTLAP